MLEVAPIAGEAIFDKPSYGSFGTTTLDSHLSEGGTRSSQGERTVSVFAGPAAGAAALTSFPSSAL